MTPTAKAKREQKKKELLTNSRIVKSVLHKCINGEINCKIQRRFENTMSRLLELEIINPAINTSSFRIGAILFYPGDSYRQVFLLGINRQKNVVGVAVRSKILSSQLFKRDITLLLKSDRLVFRVASDKFVAMLLSEELER
jgi:hypothetical protein